MFKPEENEFNTYYKTYIDLLDDKPISDILEEQIEEHLAFFDELEDDAWNYAYAPGKWTIKQVLSHIIDTEWVFSYRARCISRKETLSLPGFNQDTYVANTKFSIYTPDDLMDEFYFLRKATIKMFSNFTENQLELQGMADGKNLSVRAAGFIIAGHPIHHIQVLKQKYL